MDIKAVVNQVEGLEADAAAALISKLETAVSAIEKERDQAVHSRNEARDQMKATKERVAELESKVEEINNQGLSEQDKLAKQMEKLQAERDQYAKTAAEKEAALERTTRENMIGRIHDKQRWNRELVPAEDTLRGISAALEGVDLSDEAAVQAKVKEYVEARPSYILAEGASGAGIEKGGGAASTVPNIDELSGAELLDEKTQLAILQADVAQAAS